MYQILNLSGSQMYFWRGEISFALNMGINRGAAKMKLYKEGIRSGFNTFCKTMGDNASQLYAVGFMGSLLYVTKKVENADVIMIKDKLIEQNKQMIDLEMQVIMQGDAAAAAEARSERI